MPPRKKKQKCIKELINEEKEEADDISDDSMIDEHPMHTGPPEMQNKQIKLNIPWAQKYQPRTTSDICINPTKLKQVRQSLTNMIKGKSNTKLLVLSGPCGTSKSTTVRLLCDELISGDVFGNKIIEYDEIENFESFLNECKYKLGCVVLIDELPNVYHPETLMRFRSSLKNWIFSDLRLPPLVLIVSEYEYDPLNEKVSYSIENNMNVDTLLTKELTSLYQVENIKFNPIATRYLSRTINNIIKHERLDRNLNVGELYKLGDVRSVINNVENWVKYDKKVDMSQFLRDDSISLFHAIGKIIFSTKSGDGSDNLSIDQVVKNYPEKNSDMLNLALLENYSIYQDGKFDVSIASDIVEDLSLNDVLGGDLGIRSTRVNLNKVEKQQGVVQRTKMRFPRHNKMIKMNNKVVNQIQSYKRYISPTSTFQQLNLIDGYYLFLINNLRNTSNIKYSRLGGKFLEIYADENIIVEDDLKVYQEMDKFQLDINEKINENQQINDEEGDLTDPISDSDDDPFSTDEELENIIHGNIY